MSKTVVAAALGECVHVAGVMNFLRLAETAGWRTVFLGPAVPVEAIKSVNPNTFFTVEELRSAEYGIFPRPAAARPQDVLLGWDAGNSR